MRRNSFTQRWTKRLLLFVAGLFLLRALIESGGLNNRFTGGVNDIGRSVDSGSNQQQISGVPYVIDGDTLAFGNKRVRLRHIDAPEHSQKCEDGRNCGALAQDAMRRLVAKGDVLCKGGERAFDQYGRFLAICFQGESNLNFAMVKMGFALADRSAPTGYKRAQKAAERQDLGVWQHGMAQTPHEHREGSDSPPNLIRWLASLLK